MNPLYALSYDARDDDGPLLVGPFGSHAAAKIWAGANTPADECRVKVMYCPDRI